RVARHAGAAEVVILRARGDVLSSLDTLLMALLLPDAPIVTWWPENAPSSPVHDVLGSMSQRRITDPAAHSDPLSTPEPLRRRHADRGQRLGRRPLGGADGRMAGARSRGRGRGAAPARRERRLRRSARRATGP